MTLTYSSAKLKNLIVHKVGNKYQNESIFLNKNVNDITSNDLKYEFLNYGLSVFKKEDLFKFWHESDLKHNNVYHYVNEIFNHPTSFVINSQKIAKNLYEKSVHPNIKSGELFVAKIDNCIIGEDSCEAILFLKSENKDFFFTTIEDKESLRIELNKGLSLNNIDKGCLILNLEQDLGYKVLVVDSSSKSESVFWMNDFLNLKPIADDYYLTNNLLNLTKKFVLNRLPQEFEVNRPEQADILNKSVEYFRENTIFNENEFSKTVFYDKSVIESFNNFKDEVVLESGISIPSENFSISPSALKSQIKKFKSVIKLDRNFHIYLHGDTSNIEKGYDEKSGKHFYKIFFEREE